MIVVILIAFITVISATFSATMFQQMITFAGGSFAVLVTIALTISATIQRLKSSTHSNTVLPKLKTDAEIISSVKSMRDAGYNDVIIAQSLQIDSAVVDAIPRS